MIPTLLWIGLLYLRKSFGIIRLVVLFMNFISTNPTSWYQNTFNSIWNRAFEKQMIKNNSDVWQLLVAYFVILLILIILNNMLNIFRDDGVWITPIEWVIELHPIFCCQILEYLMTISLSATKITICAWNLYISNVRLVD